jgi:hypothetical protein
VHHAHEWRADTVGAARKARVVGLAPAVGDNIAVSHFSHRIGKRR